MEPDASLDRQVDSVLRATRVLVAVAARSLADVEELVTLPQLRVLVLVHAQERVNLLTVAEELGVHPSNATRTCERLVALGLLSRSRSTSDRRHRVLALTDAGRRLVESVTARRRSAIEEVLRGLDDAERAGLSRGMETFARAAEALHGPSSRSLVAEAGSGT